MLTDEALRQLYPFISWDEPILVHRTDGLEAWVCRYCIAQVGLKASELEAWPTDVAGARKHLADVHAR